MRFLRFLRFTSDHKFQGCVRGTYLFGFAENSIKRAMLRRSPSRGHITVSFDCFNNFSHLLLRELFRRQHFREQFPSMPDFNAEFLRKLVQPRSSVTTMAGRIWPNARTKQSVFPGGERPFDM